jgi:hypothetical protein
VPLHSSDRLHPQKGGRSATERDEFLRVIWRVMVAAAVDPRRLVFVDEMGVHTSLAPLYGYSRKGERVHLQVPRNRGRNTTLLASMTLGGMGETMAVEGSTNQEVFEAYLEHVLAPTLEAGQMVIMDNPSLPTMAGQGEGADRRAGLRVSLLTRLLTRLQSDRRGFQQDQGYAAPSRSSYEGRFGRGIGRSAFDGKRPRRSRLLQACWLSPTSPTTVKRTVCTPPRCCPER